VSKHWRYYCIASEISITVQQLTFFDPPCRHLKSSTELLDDSFRRRSSQPITWLILTNKTVQENTDKQTQYTPEKVNNVKYSKTKLPWFSCLLQHSARKRGGLILQRSRAHNPKTPLYFSINPAYSVASMESPHNSSPSLRWTTIPGTINWIRSVHP